ncbi:MAG: stage II sporulation protein R [Oscillospiraceae bacterium]|jgi:stage II sporulation protein R
MKIRIFEVILALILISLLIMGAMAEKDSEGLRNTVLRVHVIANSDSEADQAEKLRVRDAVLSQAELITKCAENSAQAEEMLAGRLEELKAAAMTQTKLPVTVTLGEYEFPTKQYDDFKLPAGSYRALRVVIGEGEGANWWCVLFPPLCVQSASATVDWAEASRLFSEGQARLITDESGGWALRFKAAELWGRLANMF